MKLGIDMPTTRYHQDTYHYTSQSIIVSCVTGCDVHSKGNTSMT